MFAMKGKEAAKMECSQLRIERGVVITPRKSKAHCKQENNEEATKTIQSLATNPLHH